jgi:hypothetical protein
MLNTATANMVTWLPKADTVEAVQNSRNPSELESRIVRQG